MYTIAAFYNFLSIKNPQELAGEMESFCQSNQILGTAILALEGINGTVCGTSDSILKLKDLFKQNGLSQTMVAKEDFWPTPVFKKLKIKVKPEIVTFGQTIEASCQRGQYLEWKEWNALLKDDQALIIDTRNDFEFKLGTFLNAINPKTEKFRDLPQAISSNPEWKGYTKIGMFCTGGVRCEKSTAYLIELGVKEVYHLKGGIIQYLKDVPREHNLWTGDCYVFDQRVALPWSYYHRENPT